MSDSDLGKSGDGCIRDLAAGTAMATLCGAMWFVLPHVNLNQWWAPFVGIVTLFAYLLLVLCVGYLERAAGATYLKRIEAQALAQADALTEEEAAEFLSPTTTSAPGGDA